MAYKCKICGKIKNEGDVTDKWCCDDFTEETPLDLTLTKESYGRVHPVNCPNGCAEMVIASVSDVNFYYFHSDIIIIGCPKCRYEHEVFTN